MREKRADGQVGGAGVVVVQPEGSADSDGGCGVDVAAREAVNCREG